MTSRRIYDRDRQAHFVTFSCYRRRRVLDHDRAKRIVLGVLNSQLALQEGRCVGFVVMPDHVHAILWFPEDDQLSHFMKQWKQRSSVQIKRFLSEAMTGYAGSIDQSEPVWQPRYYDFNLYSDHKFEEKLSYLHLNPVRAGLVARPCDWAWSSARYYEQGRSVGVPVGWLERRLLRLRRPDNTLSGPPGGARYDAGETGRGRWRRCGRGDCGGVRPAHRGAMGGLNRPGTDLLGQRHEHRPPRREGDHPGPARDRLGMLRRG
ncbi:transposase [Tautonia sp. JC769]|uniref:REP-associated tyrosine transposase n=1 Tax=Tautonia sp. JC769 TaxID=3232135 RepID=UPI003458D1FB